MAIFMQTECSIGTFEFPLSLPWPVQTDFQHKSGFALRAIAH